MAKKAGDSPIYLDLMWVITVFALILHTLAQGSTAPGADLFSGFTSWAVPAFLMLSGATAVERGNRLDRAFLDLILPTGVALIVWSAVYAVVASLLSGGAFSLTGLLSALQNAALGETTSPFWLLWLLLGLHLTTPIWSQFALGAGKGELIYLLVLALLFGSVLPLCQGLFPDAAWTELLDRLHIPVALCYVGCYLAGYFFRAYSIGRFPELILYLLGIGGLALTFWGPRLVGGTNSLWQSETAPNVIVTALALFVLFRYLLGLSDERSRQQGVHRLGGAALGIYLISPVFLLLLQAYVPFPEAFSIPLLALASFLCSLPFALLRSFLPWVK